MSDDGRTGTGMVVAEAEVLSLTYPLACESESMIYHDCFFGNGREH